MFCPAGFVSARLRGEYSVTRDDRIDLEFRNLTLNVGPFKAAEKVRHTHPLYFCVIYLHLDAPLGLHHTK